MLQACLNGSHTKDYHLAVPCTVEELVRDAQAAALAGATDLHIHPRDKAGQESLHPRDIEETLRAIRLQVPGVPIGVSTGWWITPGGWARQDHIREWRELPPEGRPDYVSVNMGEEDAPEVIARVRELGIGIEAGLTTPQEAARFAAMPNAHNCMRVLIELPEQDIVDALLNARAIAAIVVGAHIQLPRLLHGYDKTMWPIYRAAVSLGLETRIGLEDGLLLPSGERAENNAEMIRAAVKLSEARTNQEIRPEDPDQGARDE